METLDYLEKVLKGLKARYASGDKSVEAKLRAVANKIDQVKLKKAAADGKKKPLGRRLLQAARRRGCCR